MCSVYKIIGCMWKFWGKKKHSQPKRKNLIPDSFFLHFRNFFFHLQTLISKITIKNKKNK